jgi:hypothetical protein
MTLYEKLTSMHRELTINDFTTDGTILIGADTEGKEIIVSWNHPTIPQPTDEQLNLFIK